MSVSISYTNYVKLVFRSLIKEKFVTICLVTKGGGGMMKKVTNGDIGVGGSKIWYFRGDVIFEWPLI